MSKFYTLQKGFTLVELMIVVTIIGILAAIAIPNYTSYVQRSKAAEATSTLASAKIRMEQYYQDNRTYVGGPCTPTGKYFTYSCAVATITNFRLEAAPVAGLGMTGFAFSINESNVRTSTFDGTAGATCWLTAKDGTC